MDRPYSAAAERNRIPILDVLKNFISSEDRKLLEVGSGTGQHAVYLAPHFPHLIWVTSDLSKNHDGIRQWLDESGAPNIIGPGNFEVGVHDFPNGVFDIVYTANTFHIMSWANCKLLMKMLGMNLASGAKFAVYGPFNYGGTFTSDSNRLFDESLRSQDPNMGVRNFEDVFEVMKESGFSLLKDQEMPSHNRMLLFIKAQRIQ
jgi:cyclopropane fatty-acyl-phospholipid synthase-like methyltransferase